MSGLKKLLRDRKFRHGASATAITAIFIAVLIVVNLLVGSYHLNIDLTKNKMFTLSEQTLKVLKGLKQPVNIYATYTQGNETLEIKEILDRYERASANIKVKYVDTSKDTTFLDKYAESGNNIYNGSVIIESGEKYKIISPSDIVDFNPYNQQARFLLAEQRFTSSIAYLTNEEETTVYFVEGHGEASLSVLKQILENENIKTGYVQLSDEEVPEDTKLLLISAPVYDFEESEIEKLDDYLNKGGRVAFLFNISMDSLPNLENYLIKWGVTLQKDVVIEGNSQYFFQDITNLLPEMKEHPITSVLKQRELAMIVPISRSMDVLFEEQEGIKVTPLLTSSDQSWGEVNLEDNNIEKQSEDREGPLVLAASIERQSSDENNPEIKDTKIFVSGSTAFLSDQILSYYSGVANKDFFMNVISWMTDQEEIMTISPKDLADEILLISQVQQIVLLILVFLGIPIIVFILGGVVWFRRRHL